MSLAHTGILHSSMLEMSSGMEECKVTAWARNILSLAHAGILHSSMPEMSEKGLIFYILCPSVPGNCGLGVQDRISNLKEVSSILHCVILSFFHRVNLQKIPEPPEKLGIWGCIYPGLTRESFSLPLTVDSGAIQSGWRNPS